MIISILSTLLILFCLLSPLMVGVSEPAPARAEARAEEYVFRRSWGGDAAQIRIPQAIGIGPDNRIYSMNNGRMTVINQNTRTYLVWMDHIFPTTLGASIPLDIAFDLEGNIYYPVGHSIHKYRPSGELLLSWGEFGKNSGQFRSPKGIAVDKQGRVFVADCDNRRIQVFSSTGDYLRMWELNDFYPYSIAIDGQNNMYIGEINKARIHKYDLEGNYITAFGEGEIAFPYAIAINTLNQIYVVSQHIHTVEVFSADGMFLFTIGTRYSPGGQPGEFQWPEGIAIDSKDNVYVADTRNNRIQKFSKTGEFITSWGDKISLPGELNVPADIVITEQNHLLVVDSGNHRIQIFEKDGRYIRTWGSYGYSTGQLNSPSDVAIDENGVIYVADSGNSRILLFSNDGEHLDTWFGGQSFLRYPSGIDINKLNGNVYVADTGNHRVKVLNREGQELFTWGEIGAEPGNFTGLSRVVSDYAGNVYTSESKFSGRIQKFDQHGNFIASWGEFGDEYYFSYPSGLFIDKQNRLFVADTHNHRIQIFDIQGNFLASIGRQGYRPGEFQFPISIVVNNEGDMFVVDYGNNRIQVFVTEYPAEDPFSGLIQNGSFDDGIKGWLSGGELPVLIEELHPSSNSVMLLGEFTTNFEQGLSQAWMQQTFYVRPEMDQPTLWFRYNMFVNDIVHYSDFFVAIQDGVGLNHLETVVRDGYPGSYPPSAGHNMGWRTVRLDLSKYKGQHIRLVFSNRNLHSESWGIWTFVDDVHVVEASELPPLLHIFMPLMRR